MQVRYSVLLVGLNQGFVFLANPEQLIMRSHLNNLTTISLIFQHTDAVRSFDRAQAMGNHNGCTLPATLFHQSI